MLSQSVFLGNELIVVLAIQYSHSVFDGRLWAPPPPRGDTPKATAVGRSCWQYAESAVGDAQSMPSSCCPQLSEQSGLGSRSNAHCLLVDDRGYVVAVSDQPDALVELKLPLSSIDPLVMAASLEDQARPLTPKAKS